MGVFIYSFTATGKSTLSKKYKNVIDMESTIYKYLGEEKENETLKGTERIINKDWPNNYFKELKKVKDKYDYILISDVICDDFLHENNYEYWWVYPNINLKEEYLKRCKKRGNNDTFLEYLSNDWNNWCNLCKNDKYATKHIELQTGEYLEDVLEGLIKKN